MPNIVPSIGKREVAHIKLMGQMDEQMIKDNSVYPFTLEEWGHKNIIKCDFLKWSQLFKTEIAEMQTVTTE